MIVAIIIAHTDLILVGLAGVVYCISRVIEKHRGERDD